MDDPRMPGSPAPEGSGMRYGLGLIVHLTPDQRRMFRDARKNARHQVRGVSAATIASIERGSGGHNMRTLVILAEALGIEPEAIEKAGLPRVARHMATAVPAAATAPAEPAPAGLGDKLRWGMTARHENNNAARSLATELAARLPESEKTALGQFLRDVADAVRWGN
jgi:transcriptional regulator with XRE-family HTH domain